jgi:NTE family protein
VNAIRISSAVPGLYPPVERDGDLLVDGLFVENLPAMRARSEVGGYVVAVNVMPLADRSLWKSAQEPASPWRRALDLVRLGARARFPPVVDLVLYSFFLGTVADAERIRDRVDLFIEPRVGHIGFLDSWTRPEAVALGREATDEAVPGWWERDPVARGKLLG